MRKVFVLLYSLFILVSVSFSMKSNSDVHHNSYLSYQNNFSFEKNNKISKKSHSSSTASIKKIIHIHRHGARTSENEGMQLTTSGQEQLAELGGQIYEKYATLLPNATQFFQDLQVYSTNYNRTIKSAEYFLLGLFESLFSKENQEIDIDNFTSMIKIYKSQDQSDLLLNGWRVSECVKQKELIKAQINSQFFKELLAFLIPITQEISQITNSPLNTFYDAYLLYDELTSKEVEGKLSAPLNQILANKTLYHTLRFMNDFSAIYTFYGSPFQVKITTQTLMHKIFEIFNSPSSPSFSIFSAHDITIDGVFVALNLTNPNCLVQKYFKQTHQSAQFEMPYHYPSLPICLSSPQFAAHIQIEFYDDKSIKFIYNNTTYDIPSLSSLDTLTEFIQTFYKNIDSNMSCSNDHHKYLRHIIAEDI